MDKIQIRLAALLCALLLPLGAAAQDMMTVQEYMTALDAQKGTALTHEMAKLADVSKLNVKMNVDEMTAFMCSTPFQTKMVYSFSKNPGGSMTPIEFAHFLIDDLFKRWALAPLVNKDQKEGMQVRAKLMDMSNSGQKYSIAELDALASSFKYVKNED